MTKTRKVYIVMCYNFTHNNTYISEVCSNKKKAQERMDSISSIMEKYEPENRRIYWIFDQRVV